MVATLHSDSPITLDDILKRYLSDLEFEFDIKSQSSSVPVNRVNKFLINRFVDGEHQLVDHQTKKRFEDFINYFTKNKIFQLHDYEDYWLEHLQSTSLQPVSFYSLRDPYQEVEFTPYIDVEVLDIKKLRSFRKKYCSSDNVTNKDVRVESIPFVIRFDKETAAITPPYGKPYQSRKTDIQDLLKALWPYKQERGKRKKGTPQKLETLAEKVYGNSESKKIARIKGIVKSVNNQLSNKSIRVKISNLPNGLVLEYWE